MLLCLDKNRRDNINKLLKRSAEYEEFTMQMLLKKNYDSSERIRLSKVMCSVSIEHAESLKILITTGNFTSAVGMLRSQYESYVRAVWLFYSSSDIQLGCLGAQLDEQNAFRNEKLPMLSQMIDELALSAPKNALDPIVEFKEQQWKPLNSYLHGGLHAIHRHSRGYPVELLKQVLKSSNGVNGMLAMFTAVLSGNQDNVKAVSSSFNDFSDCFMRK